MKRSFWVVAVLCASSAWAEYSPRTAQGWSVLSGETVGARNTVVSGEVGWPGIDLSLLHGVSSNTDFGGRFTFNYGEEGIVREVVPGLKLQGIVRFKLLDTGNIKVGISFEPGPLFYFHSNAYCDPFGCTAYSEPTDVGLALPIALAVGIPLGGAVMVNFGVDVPLWVTFGYGGGVFIPILFGGGFEYYFDSRLALTFNVRMGPSVDTRYAVSYFDLKALVGIAYRF